MPNVPTTGLVAVASMGSDTDKTAFDEPCSSFSVQAAVSRKVVDTAAELSVDLKAEVDPVEAVRVRRKIDYHILPLMCSTPILLSYLFRLPELTRTTVVYWVQFMDKTTLGSSAILGISSSTHLTTNQYNWLGTIFYISYLVFEFPQNLALQRFPVAKWMSINIGIWAIALCFHAACTNFVGLFVVRLILGMCEGSITAGFLILTSMFYTRNEQTVRVGYWFTMNGIAEITSGFISFGTLHIKTTSFEPWQWLMVITGVITFIIAVAFWFLFPDSPTTAWFLTKEERVIAVQRIIKVNQTGVENKHFKKEQMIEAFLDPKTWLFALFAVFDDIPNSLLNQRQLIINSFGFSALQTTLLGCVDGVIEILTILSGVTLAAKLPNSRAYIAIAYFIPNILGVLLVNFLPWDNKVGLLFGVWLTGVGSTAFVLAMAWISSTTAGHTKRVTVNAIFLSMYCIGNAAGPFIWQQKYKPRNHIPWLIIGICYIVCMCSLLSIRKLLARENRIRDIAPTDNTYDCVFMERIGTDGVIARVKVDKEFLDLTDRQNRSFRYVL